MKAIRVDIVVNSLGIGGAERHSLALADALLSAGFAVRVIALATAEGAHRQDATPATASAVQIPRRSPVDLPAMREYCRLIASDAPALTITVNDYPLAFVWAARLLSRKSPMLHITHTIELPHEENLIKRWLNPLLMRVPSAISYVCELQRQHWRRAGIRARPDHCVHNGVDVTRFKPAPAAVVAATRAALHISEHDFVVGLCAVMRPEKRHDLLLRALALLWQRGELVHALMIGDGPERERIEALARSLKIEHAVHITGYQQDVVRFIGASDVMCLVSDYETLSLSILESMAMAKPVIATHAGAVAELIADTENGLLVPRNDPQALAEAIARMRDKPTRHALGQRAMDTVHSRFTSSVMNARYVSIVHQLVGVTTADQSLQT